MEHVILIEPADGNRRDFARWCLAQDPPIMTASQSGSNVPTGLFGSIPDRLLDGARIDGHIFRPVVDGFEPDGGGYRAADVPVDGGSGPEPVKVPLNGPVRVRTRSRNGGAK